MGDEGDAPPKPAANRTIQIDALTDVQLVDSVADGGSDDGEAPGAPATSLPPPLPKRAPAGPSRGSAIGLTLVAVVAGLGVAYAAVHFLFPPTPSGPPPITVIPSSVAAPTLPPTPPPETEAEPRHVHLGDDFVITVGGSGASDSPGAP